MTEPKTVNPKVIAKVEREVITTGDKLSDVLQSAPDASIWSNEEFWQRRWPSMVDRHADAHERLARLRSR
jgi:hypothetical protein